MAAAISLAVSLYAVKHHRAPGARSMATLMIAAGIWSAGYAMEIGVADFEQKVFWAKVQYLGICAIPYSVLAFGVAYSGRRLGRAAWAMVGIIPVAMFGLVSTNGRHDLVWSSISPSAENLFLVLDYGPAFWVFWVYSYVVITTGVALVTTVVFQSRRLYLMQSVILILGLLAPWLGNSLYVLELLPGDGRASTSPRSASP